MVTMRTSSRFQKLVIVAAAIIVVGVVSWATISSIRAANAPSGFTATAGDTQVTLTWNDPNDNTITGYQVLQVAIDKLVVPSTVTGAIEAGDRFGDSVGIAGNTAVVGAPLQESLDNQSVSITNGGWGHTFSRGSGGWSYDEFLAVSNPQVEGRLGSSVAVAGSTVMAGAPSYTQNNNTDPGEITIASKSSLTDPWATEFTKTGQFGNDLFGRSVALDTGIAVVGAPGALIGSDALAGKAYLYTKDNSGVWGPAATAIWSAGANAGAGTIFGSSVAVDGNTVVIGSPGEDSSSGAAYVFTKDALGIWSAVRLTASDRANADSFGRWVAVDGDFVVVGAWQDDDGGTDSGSVYVFTKPSGGWGAWSGLSSTDKSALTAKLTASDAAADDHFGWSVAVDGDNVVVGAYGNDDNGNDSGSVYLFTKPSGGWVTATETVKLTAPDGTADDNFGDSVAAGGGRAIVGAPGDESETGAAYVFSIPTWTAITGSGSGTRSYTVTGLDNDVEYTFWVRPVDSGGPGPASGSKHAKPQQAPAATPANLTATAGVGEVTLAWDDPNDSTITGYKYRQKVAAGSFGQWTTIPDSAYGEANTTGYTVRNLTDGQTYTFRIQAVDEAGDTGNSNDVTVTTILAAPTNLTATVGVDAGQIALNWDDPGNNLITKYQYSTDGGTSFTDITGSGATTTAYTVTGLSNGREYTLAVRAVNASVNGQAATVTAMPLLPPVPLYVSNIGQPTDTSVGVDADVSSDQAQGFRTGPNVTGYVLGSIDVHFQSAPGSGVLTVSVRSPNGITGYPDALVHTLTNPGTIEPGFVRFTAENAQLSANTFYFVHLTFSGTGTTPLLRTTASDALDSGTATGWTMNDFRYYRSGANWFSSSNALKISINNVPPPVPGAPANLSATPGDGEVTLSWGDPSNDTIEKYQYSTDGGTTFIDIPGSDKDTIAYTVTGLSNGTTHTLAVRAKNISGEGDESSVTVLMIPAAPANLTAMPGDGMAALSWDDPGNTTITEYQLMQLAEESGLTADDGAKNDRFGVSVAVDGNTAVVGAFQPTYTDPDTSLDVSRPGAAYVYIKDSNGAWSQQAKLTASDGADGDEFGISVAVDGDNVVVGARGDDLDKGAIYVFSKPADDNWTSTITETKLTATGGEADDLFGASVALYGDTIVVGAPRDQIEVSGGVARSGSAYVFTKNSGVWSQAANLTATDAATGDEFGISVAVDDDTIAVGAYGKDGNSITDSGLVYVFVKSGGAAWATTTETVQLRASDRAANDNFGRSVAVNGSTVVVGASGDRNTVGGTEVSTGSAYVFTRPDNGWTNSAGTETAKLTATDAAHTDQFGRSVAVYGDTILVGAHQNDDDGTDSGSIYVFIKPTNGWTDTTGTVKLTASNAATGDRFGIALALDGDTALVAAPRNDANDDDDDTGNDVSDAGSAYVIGTSGWAKIPDTAAAIRSQTVTGLTNNIKHTFAMRAVNASGNGPASTVTGVPMPVPAAPVILSATPGDGRVTLSWTNPGDDTITKYQYSADYIINGGGMGNSGGATFSDIPGSQADTTAYTVTGLDNGVTHTLAVRAVNNFGNGMPSTVTALMVPAAPRLSAAPGDGQVALSWDDPGNDTIEKYQLWRMALGKLAVSEGAKDDKIGLRVAVDDGTAVVGAPGDDNDKGTAYVFTKNLTTSAWSKQTNLTVPGGVAGDNFGFSIAVSGDTVVIGAYENDGGKGSAYVFTRVSGTWSLQDTLTASDGEADDWFGYSVAVDGDTAVIGAYEDDDGKGSAYVFTRNAGAWDAWVKLTASDGAINHLFGASVAVDGATIVVGANRGLDNADIKTGSAYLFTKPLGGWATANETAKLTPSDGKDLDWFGRAVAVDDDTVVIGAYAHPTDSKLRSGAAYLFTKPAGVWVDATETVKLAASDGAAQDYFGSSVAVDGDLALISAAEDNDNGIFSGSAYLFTRNSGAWNETVKLTAPDGARRDYFGWSVALDGNDAVFGAYLADAAATDSGAAYVLDIGDWADVSGSNATTTSHKVTGLTNYTGYWFQIRAVNETGAGPASNSASATPRIGKPAKPTGMSAQAGDAQVMLNWDDPMNSTIDKYQISEVIPEHLLTASGGAASDHFGISVAIDGNTAVVGADRANNRKGSVYIFTRDSNGDWTQQAKLDGENDGDQFGWSVAVEGDIVVVGAHAYDGGATLVNSGAAYVFTRTSGVWSQAARLTATFPEAYAFFGGSVALDGNTLAIGSRLYDAGGRLGAGAAYVFTKDSGTGVWSQAAKLTASTSLQLAYLGYSLAVDGDTVLVGAYGDDTVRGELGSGSAYVFDKPSGGWTDGNETAKLTASDRQPSGYFGFSVALDGDTAVIGASQHSDPITGAGSGAAYVFTRQTGVWGEKAKLTPSDASARDNFGVSVAVEGDTVVVGSWQDDDNGRNSGSAYVFTKPALGWAGTFETLKLTAPNGAANDRFGWSVAVDLDDQRGDLALVGAYSDDHDAGINAGSAHVLGIPKWVDIDGSDDATISHNVTKELDDSETDLSNGEEYAFQIRAMNRSGYGPASDGVSAKPLGVPAALGTLTPSEGDTQVKLSWAKPAKDDAIATITKYEYEYSGGSVQVSGEIALSDIIEKDDNTVEYTIVSLENDTTYTFKLRAVNVFGAGPEATNTGTPEGGTPAAPQNLIATSGDTQVRLIWDDPRDASIDKYILSTDGTNYTDIDLQDIYYGVEDKFRYTVTGLTNGTEYTFHLRAVDNREQGDAATVTATPAGFVVNVGTNANDPIRPAAPTGFTATGGHRHVKLTWDDPDDASIDKYQYQYLQADEAGNFSDWGVDWTDVPSSNASSTEYIHFGLTNGVNYRFRIRAVDLVAPHTDDDDEFGDPSDGVEATPLPEKPTVPTNLNVTGRNQEVTLTWRAPPGSVVDKYEVLHLQASALVHPSAMEDDKFGYSVAVDGDIAVVGAYLDDADESNGIVDSGAAYVFTRSGGVVWDEGVKLTASDGNSYDNFGISVAVDGNTLVIGASGDDDNGADSGSVYVFTRDPDSGVWSQAAKLTASDGEALDYLGHSVAVSGDTVLVGAYLDDREETATAPELEDSGAVYVFVKPDSEDGWADELYSGNETTKLTPSKPADDDRFGTSVALDSDTAVIGAPGDDDNGIDSGSVYVFTKPDTDANSDGSTDWKDWGSLDDDGRAELTAKLTASDGAAQDNFGHSVAVDGETVVIGASGDDDNGADSGSVYVFTKANGVWIQAAKLTAFDGEAQDNFGFSVAVNADTILIGAYGDDDNGSDSGSAYVFTRDPVSGSWRQTNKLTEETGKAGDWFGYSVAVDTEVHTALIGAGSAHVMDIHDWEEISANGPVITHTFTDLTNNQKYDFQVRAVNLAGAGDEAVAEATPQANTNPEFEYESVTFYVLENSLAGDFVGSVAANDLDRDELTYSKLGTGAAYFDIGLNSGAITVRSGAVLDYESGATVYTFTARVTDGMDVEGHPDNNVIDDSITVAIIVTDVDEGETIEEPRERNKPPSFNEGNSAARTVPENAPAGTAVGAPVTARDGDNDRLEYWLSGTEVSTFEVDRWTGQLTTKTLLDYEVQSEYLLQMRVRDGRGGVYGINLTITVVDVDEPPSQPGAPEVSSAGPTGLAVGWTAPDNQGPGIIDYDVRYREAGGEFRDAGYDGVGLSTTLEDLRPGTGYEVQVRAINAEGTSAWSESGRGETEDVPPPSTPTPTPEPTSTPTPEPTSTPTPDPTSTPTPDPTPTPTLTSPSPSPTPTAEPETSEADGGDEGFPWWAITVVLIGIVAGVVLIVVALRSRR